MPIAGGQAALPRVFIAPLYPGARRFADFENDHGGPVRYFGQLLAADPRMRARVLDAGCGGDYPVLQLMRQALSRCRQLDGVDPDPIVWNHPRLTRRWCSTLEQSDVPAAAYDAVFTYNVLEHVRDARAFLAKACHVLKPGGVLYAFTPHAVHPFALCSRCVQVLGLRRIWSRHSRQKVNS